jgi:hypothetical protein
VSPRKGYGGLDTSIFVLGLRALLDFGRDVVLRIPSPSTQAYFGPRFGGSNMSFGLQHSGFIIRRAIEEAESSLICLQG